MTHQFDDSLNVLVLVKEQAGETYVFLFNEQIRAECLRTLGRFASNKDLSFNWYDAAHLSQKIREGATP